MFYFEAKTLILFIILYYYYASMSLRFLLLIIFVPEIYHKAFNIYLVGTLLTILK